MPAPILLTRVVERTHLPYPDMMNRNHEKHYYEHVRMPSSFSSNFRSVRIQSPHLRNSRRIVSRNFPCHQVPAEPYRIALWGDLPYLGNSIDVFDPEDEYGSVYTDLKTTMNDFNPVFSIHSGDVKSGGGSCGELSYKRWEDIMNSLNHPAFISLGDNDWTDCHRLSNGNYDPLERLEYLRHRFYADSYTIYGSGSLHYNVFCDDYPEMHWWVYGDVMYVNAHIIGSNNGLYDGVDRGCDPYLAMIDPGCEHAIAEAKARTEIVNQLVSAAFEIAMKDGLAGVMGKLSTT